MGGVSNRGVGGTLNFLNSLDAAESVVISLAMNGIGLNDPTNHRSEKPHCSLYENARVSVCVSCMHGRVRVP